MRKIVVLGAFGLAALGLAACTTSQQRVGGAGAGAVAGAAVAGPVGAVAGGVVGAAAGPTVADATGVPKRRVVRKKRVRTSS